MDDFDVIEFPVNLSLKNNYDTITLKDSNCYTKEITSVRAKTTTKSNLEALKTDNEQIISVDEFYKRFVFKTFDLCIEESKAPQRSKLWHDARRFCITASSFAAAVGNNKYCSPRDLLMEKLWASFKGSEATEYGTFHEMDAQNSLIAVLQSKPQLLQDLYFKDFMCTSFKIQEVGLLKHYSQPWMAVSPDGILILEGTKGPRYILIEYKCPANLRDSLNHPYSKSPFNVPEYYMDQIQGIMGLLNKFPDLLLGPCNLLLGPCKEDKNLDFCLFVVWQSAQLHITRVPYKKKYYEDFLEPALKEWYFEQYLPMAVLKHNNKLKKNTLEYIITI